MQFLLPFCWLCALCVFCAGRGCSPVCHVKFFMVSDLPYLLICKENACGFLALSLKVVKKELGIHKQAQGTGSQKCLSNWKTVAGTPCCAEKRVIWKSIQAFWITASCKETLCGRNETVKEHVCASGGLWAQPLCQALGKGGQPLAVPYERWITSGALCNVARKCLRTTCKAWVNTMGKTLACFDIFLSWNCLKKTNNNKKV